MTDKPQSIFINPNFVKTNNVNPNLNKGIHQIHINPNFVKTSNTNLNPNKSIHQIHINPRFFVGVPLVAEPTLSSSNLQSAQPVPVINNAIIRNTRRFLLRTADSSIEKKPPQKTFIKVSNNKIVTASYLMKSQQKENEIIKRTTENLIKTRKLNRKLDPLLKNKKKIVSTYSIRRVDAISPKKIRLTDQKFQRM